MLLRGQSEKCGRICRRFRAGVPAKETGGKAGHMANAIESNKTKSCCGRISGRNHRKPCRWRCAYGRHPYPSRTRRLRRKRPMVLHRGRCGRAGGCRLKISHGKPWRKKGSRTNPGQKKKQHKLRAYSSAG